MTPSSYAQVNVTTYHNDIGRTGQNLNETILTPSNVNGAQFGKLFSQPVDGQVYAQPLYMSGIPVNGANHNVVFVATENDTVYAFDADTNGGQGGGLLWQASMLSPSHGAAAGATPVSTNSLGADMHPQVGITGTPVIDPTTNTLYLVSATFEGSLALQRLHALDITTGAEKPGSPVAITASVPGTGNGSINGTLTFDPWWQNQRGGLILINGIVYIPYASHGDNGPWHGWILGYNASTLQQTGAYCTSPNGTGSGIWGAGDGVAGDIADPVNHPFGRLFAVTGNGDFNAQLPYTNSMDYGDSHIALDLTNGVPTVSDDFTTYQQALLNAQDMDQGSGGMIVLPDQTTGPYPHLAAQSGKSGTLFLLNRDGLGGYHSSDQVVQTITNASSSGMWATPAYWNGNLYIWGRADNLKSFSLANGQLSTNPTSSTDNYSYPGSTPAISANGNTNGIVWSINTSGYGPGTPAVLQAHDASNVATTLWASNNNLSRDSAGPAVKFIVPTIANGKVYVGTANELDIYGLLGGVVQAQTPVISPGSQSFNNTLNVTISDGTPNATIYYTTDGSRPTVSSNVYTGPIPVSSTETIRAIAGAGNMLLSQQASATYTASTQTPAVTFSLPTGTYTNTLNVTLSDVASNTVIYYTLDGSTPTTSSSVYSGPIAISSTTTLTALGVAPNLTPSPILSQTYTIQLGQTGIAFGEGFASSTGQMILNGSTGLDDSRLQLTSGLANQAGSAWYVSPVSIQSFTTDFTYQLSNPNANGMTFTIQNSTAKTAALGGNGAKLGYSPISSSVAIKFDLYNAAGEGPNSTGLYTNGVSPSVPAIDLSQTGINLHSGDTMAVHLVYDGTTLSMTITDFVTAAVWSTSWAINIPATIGSPTAYVGFTGSTGGKTASQKILTWSFVTTSPQTTVATPTFSPAAGTYASAQSVSIRDTTPGSTIYYTTNGSTPTTSSAVYAGPLTVNSTQTLKAMAAANGYTGSAVGSALFTIATPTATPTFTPASGVYTTAQSVSISDVTPGAVIYYTTNGSTPTTFSPVYTIPIPVTATQTINAIAVASGLGSSAVASAPYTINKIPATPVFSLASGTYTSAQSVTLTDATTGAAIYYTTDGSIPTTASNLYSGPITVGQTEAVNAIASAGGYNSAVATASYTISTSAPVINYNPGFTTAGLSLNGSKVANNGLLVTDGTSNEQHSAWFSTPVNIQAFTTDFTFQNSSATADGFTFAIQNAPAGTRAVGGNGAQLGYGGISNSVAIKFDLHSNSGEGSDSTGFYLNGAVPTMPSVDMTASGVNLHSADIFSAHITYDGATLTLTLTDTVTNASFTTSSAINIPGLVGGVSAYVGFTGGTGGSAAVQNVLTWTYLVNPSNAVATPSISPASGTYTSAQNVTITSTTPGASIYYTTDGSTPSAASTLYAGPIPVTATQTINAIGIKSGSTNSSVATAVFTISYVAAAPTFSLAPGTYYGAQSVSLLDSTPGAAIYYTVDGSTPTTASSLYSGPLAVTTSQTINALAVAAGYNNSTIASAVYSISTVTATPAFSPAPGSYPVAQSVTLADTTPGAAIYYTTDGSTPTTASNLYAGPIAISSTQTLQAIAIANGLSGSATATGAYTINPNPPAINFSSGFTATGLSFVGAKIVGNTLQVTDGGSNEQRAAWFTTPVNVQNFTTDFTFQDTSANADGFTFTLQNATAKTRAVGGGGSSLGSGGLANSVAVKFDLHSNAGEGSDSTGFYLNGAAPTVPSVDMTSSGVNLHSGNILHAHLTYDGATLTLTLTDTVTNATFTTSQAINIPGVVGASTAYAGFTGGTGGSSAIQTILSWTY